MALGLNGPIRSNSVQFGPSETVDKTEWDGFDYLLVFHYYNYYKIKILLYAAYSMRK